MRKKSLRNRSVNKCRRVNFGLLCVQCSEVEHSANGYPKTQFSCINQTYSNCLIQYGKKLSVALWWALCHLLFQIIVHLHTLQTIKWSSTFSSPEPIAYYTHNRGCRDCIDMYYQRTLNLILYFPHHQDLMPVPLIMEVVVIYVSLCPTSRKYVPVLMMPMDLYILLMASTVKEVSSAKFSCLWKSLMAEWLEWASQWHETYCHDLEVKSSNPSWVKLGVHSTSVLSHTWTKQWNILDVLKSKRKVLSLHITHWNTVNILMFEIHLCLHKGLQLRSLWHCIMLYDFKVVGIKQYICHSP